MSPSDATPLPLDDVARVVRDLDAPRDEVWAALSAPDGLEGWLADRVDVALTPGAEGTIDTAGERRQVTVDEVVPARRIAFRWAAPGGEPTVVDLVLDDAPDDRTRLTVVETPLRVLRAVGTPADAGPLRAGPGGGAGRPTALAAR